VVAFLFCGKEQQGAEITPKRPFRFLSSSTLSLWVLVGFLSSLTHPFFVPYAKDGRGGMGAVKAPLVPEDGHLQGLTGKESFLFFPTIEVTLPDLQCHNLPFLQGNLIMVGPTGIGKTLCAVQLLREAKYENGR